jgi:hypothetical protein
VIRPRGVSVVGMAKTRLLRGIQLVDAVMQTRRAKGERLKGLAAANLARARLGDRPLSPALRRWLEQDKDMFTLGKPQSITELIESEFGSDDGFGKLRKYLKAPCVLFEGWGADSRRFLYLGKTDEHREYSVFTVDIDDVPYACINGPVDVWLAQNAGFLEEEHVYGHVPAEYEEARRTHARLNFGGYVSLDDDELYEGLSSQDD